MERLKQEEFNEIFRIRTKNFAVELTKYCKKLPNNYIDKVIVNQLIRSGTSVAANYRAACRARSEAEFFSKMSIVVEEADETQLWLEIILEAEIDNSEIHQKLYDEISELVKVFAKARKTVSNTKSLNPKSLISQ